MNQPGTEVRQCLHLQPAAALEFERKITTHTCNPSGCRIFRRFYHVSAKIIQLKSYYELEETEPFFSLLEASRK